MEAANGVRDAASVILLRGRAAAIEVLLVQRRRRASFMARSWVFPGGAVDPSDADPREAAIRELFEEAGVLLARGRGAAEIETLRRRVLDGAEFRELLAAEGRAPDVGALHYFAHWITPSAEPKRFSARFYVAALPGDQEVDTGAGELDAARWLDPRDALASSGALRLPPPQIRILRDLADLATRGGTDAILASCEERARHAHPILPRAAPRDGGFALLLPWDPDYETLGTGDALPIATDHPLAEGPSRFILEDSTWTHTYAPPSPNAD